MAAAPTCPGCGRRLLEPGRGPFSSPSRWCDRCGGSARLAPRRPFRKTTFELLTGLPPAAGLREES